MKFYFQSRKKYPEHPVASTFFVFQDHIQEVLNKWESIDDEIWAKIIVLGNTERKTDS